MPNFVSYLANNSFTFKLEEGMVYDTRVGVWDDPDVEEKERLMVYEAKETET